MISFHIEWRHPGLYIKLQIKLDNLLKLTNPSKYNSLLTKRFDPCRTRFSNPENKIALNRIQKHLKMHSPAAWRVLPTHLSRESNPFENAFASLVESSTSSTVTGFKPIGKCILQLGGEFHAIHYRDSNPFENAFASWVESFTYSTITGFIPIQKCIRQLGGEFHAIHYNGIQIHLKMYSPAVWRVSRTPL